MSRPRSFRIDAAFGVFAALLSVLVTSLHYGGLQEIGRGALSMVDSASYNTVGNAIWSFEKPSRSSVGQRGYLYPAFGTAILAVAPWLLTFVQALATGFGVACLVGTERILAGRVLLTPVALLSFSLLLAPGHLMTEAIAFTLAALALRLFVGHVPAWGVLALVLAALVKPAFWVAVPFAAIFALRMTRTGMMVLVLSAMAIAPQLWLSGTLDGKAALSKSGSTNFERRFFPAVYGFAEHASFVRERDALAEIARSTHPERLDQIAYVLSRPAVTVSTWARILWDHHLFEPSGFSRRDNATALDAPRKWIETHSLGLNLIFTLLALPAVLGALLALWAGSNGMRAAVFLPAAVIATAPLVYFQGDRVIYIGLLLALPFAGYAIRRMTAALGASP